MIPAAERWADALLALRLLLTEPAGLKGAVIRARAGPVRDAWLDALRDALPPGSPWLRVPALIGEDRLLGGLDLAATLAAGRPVAQTGLLAEADGGVLLVPMAERLSTMAAALMADAIDRASASDALGSARPARFLAILIDEGVDDERVPDMLAERLAFRIDLEGIRLADLAADGAPTDAEQQARVADPVAPICAVAAALGIGSLRAPALALCSARAHAGLAGRADFLAQADLEVAVRLVLAPRATCMPPTQAEPPEPPPAEDPGSEAETQPAETRPAETGAESAAGEDPAEMLVETARAAIPAGLLELLASGAGNGVRRAAADGGRGAGNLGRAPTSGRGAGVRAGRPGPGLRLDLVETLKAAAPWQGMRRREGADRPVAALLVRASDFRVRRLVRRMGSTILFVVDASGSSAMARLGEAKGAAELLLADAYVRRDDVAMIAFHGEAAELLLPPTRSLPRARRALADLAGGGGTPMAIALDAARTQALAVRARGRTPLVVLLTDGRANIAADGTASAARAATDALTSAKALRALGVRTLFIDTAARPRPEGRALADAMGARHVALPRISADAVRDAVRAVA